MEWLPQSLTQHTCNDDEKVEAIERTWLNVHEIAKHLGAKPATIYAWVHLKRIPPYKVGRLLRFRREEIDSWVMSKRELPD